MPGNTPIGGGKMTALEKELEKISEEVSEELDVNPERLSIGGQENPSQTVPILIERMDRICGLMDFQSTLISKAEVEEEEARYKYKRSEKDYKHELNRAYIAFKQDDRQKFGSDFKKHSRTDPEYQAMAELEVETKLNFVLQCERDYLAAQHRHEDAKHKYETLNNHFLSYRKSCDLLKTELEKLNRYSGA